MPGPGLEVGGAGLLSTGHLAGEFQEGSGGSGGRGAALVWSRMRSKERERAPTLFDLGRFGVVGGRVHHFGLPFPPGRR